MSRVNHKMNLMEAVQAVSNGIPGTIAVLARVMKEYPKYDPENSMGIFGYIFTMDMFQIYDEGLWIIHSRLCDMQIVKTIAILRALQLGLITPREINNLLQSNLVSLDFLILITEIRTKVPNFAQDYEI